MTVIRALWTGTVTLALAGTGLRITRPPLGHRAADSLTLALPAQPVAPASRAVPVARFQAIVVANVFSPTRAAPRVRFVPSGLAQAAKALAAPPPPAIRLYGITVGERGAVTIIEADPTIPGAEIYRVGDLVAGAPIIAITDSTVTIARSSGPLVLRLQPAQRRKP